MYVLPRIRAFLLALTLSGLSSYLGVSGCRPAFAAQEKGKKTVAQHKAAPAASKTKATKTKAAGNSKNTAHKVAVSKKAGEQKDNVHKAAAGSAAGFKLNATIDSTNPGNSAVDTYGSLGAGNGAPAPVTFDRKFDMLVTPKVKEEKAQSDVASAKKAAVDKTAELQAAEASSVDWSGWAAQLADHWFSNLKNLEYNSHRGWTTNQPAMVQFTCHADGRITNIQLRQSCGNKAYDDMQIEALKRTIPCPAFPAGTHLNSYTLIQGWEAHPRNPGEQDYKPGSFGHNMPAEKVPPKK